MSDRLCFGRLVARGHPPADGGPWRALRKAAGRDPQGLQRRFKIRAEHSGVRELCRGVAAARASATRGRRQAGAHQLATVQHELAESTGSPIQGSIRTTGVQAADSWNPGSLTDYREGCRPGLERQRFAVIADECIPAPFVDAAVDVPARVVCGIGTPISHVAAFKRHPPAMLDPTPSSRRSPPPTRCDRRQNQP